MIFGSVVQAGRHARRRFVPQRWETLESPVDEPWGVRRFFVRDPQGVVISVLAHGNHRDSQPRVILGLGGD